jgi:hypothetical protein
MDVLILCSEGVSAAKLGCIEAGAHLIDIQPPHRGLRGKVLRDAVWLKYANDPPVMRYSAKKLQLLLPRWPQPRPPRQRR